MEPPKPKFNTIEQSPLSTASTSKFCGFSMASGRTLKFNEEHLKKIASDFAKDDEKFEKEPQLPLDKKPSHPPKTPQALEPPKPKSNIIEQSPLSTASTSKFVGFSMASGRALKFNEEHLKKIASDFAKDDEKFEKEPQLPLEKKPSHPNKKPQALVPPKPKFNIIDPSQLSTASTSKFCGFSMAPGRTLKLSDAENLMKIALDFAKDYEKFEKEPQLPLVNKPSISSKIPRASEAPKPVIDNKEQCPPAIASTPRISCFATASGRTLMVDLEELKKIALGFAKEDKKCNNESLLEQGINSSLLKSNQMLETPKLLVDNKIPELPDFSMNLGCSHMLTASNLKIISSQYQREDKINGNLPLLPQVVEAPNNNEEDEKFEEQPLYQEFQLTKSSHDTMEEVQSVEAVESEVESEVESSVQTTESDMELYRRALVEMKVALDKPSFGLIMAQIRKYAVKKPIEVSIIEPSASTSAQYVLNNTITSSTPIKTRDPSSKRKFELDNFSSMCSPVMKAPTRIVNEEDVGTPVVKSQQSKLQTPTESQEVKSVLEVCKDLDDSIENIQPLPKKRRLGQTKLLSQFNKSAELNSSWNDVDMELLKSVEMSNNIDISVRKARKVAIETQLEIIVHKEQTLCCPVVGSMFKKKQGLQRMKISTYVDQQKPKQLNRHQVTFATALDYHFNMQNYLR